MQARRASLLAPLVLFVVLSLSLRVHNGVRAGKVTEEDKEKLKRIPSLHTHVEQEEGAVIDGLSVGQKEYEAFDQLIKTMADIKALFEQDSQLNYETIQLIPAIDITAFVDLLRRATAAKFELLARLVDDLASGVSRSAIAMLDDAQTSLKSRKRSPTDTARTSTTTSTVSTATTKAKAILASPTPSPQSEFDPDPYGWP